MNFQLHIPAIFVSASVAISVKTATKMGKPESSKFIFSRQRSHVYSDTPPFGHCLVKMHIRLPVADNTVYSLTRRHDSEDQNCLRSCLI